MSSPERILLISDASLPSLCAALAHPDPALVYLWDPSNPAEQPTHSLPLLQADRFGFSLIPSDDSPPPTTISNTLSQALRLARVHSCAAVVWPIVAGDNIAHLAAAAERAQLVSRLDSLDHPNQPPIPVRIPLADHTPSQLADIAADLDIPADACASPTKPRTSSAH